MSCKSHVNKQTFVYDKNNKWGADFQSRVRSHEPETNKKLIELIRKMPRNALIVDAGAHVGDTGLLIASEMKRAKNSGKVVEVDPDKTKLEFIDDTAKKNHLEPFVHIVNSGLSDTRGHGSLDKSMHAGGWFVKEGEGNDFKLDTLDNLLLNIDGNVFLIKLDVEGHEVKALSGSRQTIAKHHPIIMVEVVEKQLKRNGHTRGDIEKFMRSINYVETWRGGMDRLYQFAADQSQLASCESMHNPNPNHFLPVFAGAVIICIVIVVIALVSSIRKRN